MYLSTVQKFTQAVNEVGERTSASSVTNPSKQNYQLVMVLTVDYGS